MLPVINTYVHWGLFLSTFFKFILECFYYHFRIRPNIKNSSENWKAHLQASKCKAFLKAAAAAKSLQSCPTLCDPIEAAHQVPLSLGFSRQEHWSRLPFPSLMHESEKWKWSRVWLIATPWTVAYQAPPSMGYSRQEYGSGLPLPSPFLKRLVPKIKFGILLFLSKKKVA